MYDGKKQLLPDVIKRRLRLKDTNGREASILALMAMKLSHCC